LNKVVKDNCNANNSDIEEKSRESCEGAIAINNNSGAGVPKFKIEDISPSALDQKIVIPQIK